MLSDEQRREILAVGLLALALFLALALLPVSLLGERGEAWFPGGNTMGLAGDVLRRGLVAGLGGGSVFVPVLVLLGGLRAGAWLGRGWALRLAVLVGGLLLLSPPILHLGGSDPFLQGWWGEAVGARLVAVFGWLGSVLLLTTVLVALSVGTVGWNPLRSMIRAAARGGGIVGKGLRWVGGGLEPLTRVRRGGEESGEGSPEEAEPEGSGPDSTPAEEASEESAEVVRRKRGESPALTPGAELPDPTDPALLEDPERPPLDLLTPPEARNPARMERELDRLGEVLVEKLDTFNVECEVADRTTGPVVTQFELIPAPGIKVNRIANLDADLALAMKAQSVRIVAPIPGKGAVGVEIPNPEPEIVRLREILASRAYRKSPARLPLAMGKDLTGEPYVADLARMPHLLIAGATGSGKSVCLNTVITSLVFRHTPETLRLLLIDPKMVELSAYVDLPHLRHPVVTDPKEAAGVLRWAVLEMERRYQLLSVNGVRSIDEFNRRVEEGRVLRRAEAPEDGGDSEEWRYDDGVLPYVVVVVDELADLMMTVQAEVEKPLTQLAQKARAIGIHLIVATQRPSVNVITGLIKANFPTRIAFRVASKTDSRTILDQNGADALLGNGDMLFLPPGTSEPVRIQGAFVGTDETDRLTAWYRERLARDPDEAVDAPDGVPEPGSEADILEIVRAHELEEASEAAFSADDPEEWDELFKAAGEICVQNDQGSTSLLQRKLRIGYGRAARIVDQLHEAGVLGPPDGTKPREVLVGLDELETICSAAKTGGEA